MFRSRSGFNDYHFFLKNCATSITGENFSKQTFGNTIYHVQDTIKLNYQSITSSYFTGANASCLIGAKVILILPENIDEAETIYKKMTEDKNRPAKIKFIFIIENTYVDINLEINLRKKNYAFISCGLNNIAYFDLTPVFGQIKNICNTPDFSILSKTPAQLEEKSAARFGLK